MSSRTGRTKIEDLYFGVVSRAPNGGFEIVNLFDLGGVRLSVAAYRAQLFKYHDYDPLLACFNGVWSRCEYEMMLTGFPTPYTDSADDKDKMERFIKWYNTNAQKFDLYRLYVEPNRDHLLSLVDSVSEASARYYLKEWRKKHGRRS